MLQNWVDLENQHCNSASLNKQKIGVNPTDDSIRVVDWPRNKNFLIILPGVFFLSGSIVIAQIPISRKIEINKILYAINEFFYKLIRTSVCLVVNQSASLCENM